MICACCPTEKFWFYHGFLQHFGAVKLNSVFLVLVGDWDVAAGSALELAADHIRDLLVLCLLRGALVVLPTLTHHILLHPVDTWGDSHSSAPR